MPRALLTGATGFIGSRLAHHLERHGWDVHRVVRPTPGSPSAMEPLPPNVHIHDGSTSDMIRIVGESRPDVVFHLASLFIAQHSPDQVEPLVRSNILFGLQLLEGMAWNGVRRIVNAGTGWQHYEGGEYSPVNLYAATKQAFEDLAAYYVDSGRVDAVTLLLFDTYGPDDPRPKIFRLLLDASASGKVLSMSPGDQLIDLVHVDDVTSAFRTAGERLLEGSVHGHERYAVSSGNPISLRNLAGNIVRAAGLNVEIIWGGRPHREREVMVPWAKGAPMPGWRPQISLDEGLRAIFPFPGSR